MTNRVLCAAASLAVLAGCWMVPSSPIAAAEIDFNRDIRPILSEHCFACHGFNAESRQADLRLDLAEHAHAARDGKTPLSPGNVAASEVWTRIASTDPDQMMPPPDANLPLSDKDKQAIKAWIEQGARCAAHWSFVPPKKAALGAELENAQAADAIDYFVNRRLAQQAALSKSPEADRYTLIRRLSLGLTGLPPSADEVAAFATDSAPDAYEKLVDRLLASPHFGERMALDWLDAARYADTNGFSIDGGRHIWLWRDWVIDAFNRNKPYDEFLIEQIAGDLLPDPTPAQLIASGFQRNNMVTHEGGTIPEENLTNYNVDRVKTLGEAVLGLTLACAQCHDHKYDPISQKDFYSLFAYFNTLGDVGLDGNRGINPRPQLQARTVLQTGEIPGLKRRIARLQERLKHPSDKLLALWEAEQQAVLALRGQNLKLAPLQVLKISTPNRGTGFEIEKDRVVRVTEPSGLAAYDVLAQLPADSRPITGLRVVFYPDDDTPGGGWGYGPKSGRAADQKGSFVLTALSVSVGQVPADQVDLFRILDAKQVTANSWQTDHRPELVLDTRNENGWAPLVSHDGAVHLTMTFDEPINATETPYLTAQLNFGSGNNMIAARMQLFGMTGTDDGSHLTPEVIEALSLDAAERSPDQVQTLRSYFAAHAPQTERTRTDLANAEERLAVLTGEFPTMVMNVESKPRTTYILNRGDYSQPTVAVSVNTPASLPALDGPQADRLSLARWIVMPEHPLTARVYVNRVWQMMFGAGLVRTPADFGSQGEPPSHPELMDWLAVDFEQHDWDVKRLMKAIAMSATYRQSSATSRQQLERDPQNRLLSRGPRVRLPAEFIRDAALRVSGLLVPQLGGPSVNPYTPGDLWREISHYGSTPATAQTFVQDHGEKLYRRSLYTFWKRTAPPPNMAAFDAPNRETCVVSRPTTNTPLQALVLLNDVQYVEAARAFAERILKQGQDDRGRIQWAILTALSRPAIEQELDVFGKAIARERARYRADPAAAQRLLAVGESPRDPRIPLEEHAAWMQIASTILNLSETVTSN